MAAVVDYVNASKGVAKMPGLMALGYIASFTERLAMSVIVSHGVAPLADALKGMLQYGTCTSSPEIDAVVL